MIDILTQLRVRGRAIWRRRWIALATAWALMLLGSTIVVLLPDQYEASARVYVDTDSLMRPLLKGIAVEDDPTQQLAIMQSTLLSRPNLMDVARAVYPGIDAKNEVKLEGTIDNLKSRTVVQVEGKKLFRIANIQSDPRLAKDVVQSFLNIFVEGNLGQDRSDMENAQSFIAKQLSFYEEQLRETEKRIADFRAKQSNVISGGSNLGELRAELNKKQVIYSDQHPDVVALKRQIEALEEQNAQANMASSAASAETQLADLNRDYAVLKERYDELRERAESARISEDARTDTASLRFRIIEAPEVPVRPSGPKRTLLLLAVLFASLGGGLALAFLLSEMDDSFATPRSLGQAFNLPLLGGVCLIPRQADGVKRRFDATALSVGTGSMVVLCALLIALTSDVFRIDLTPLRQLANSLLGTGA